MIYIGFYHLCRVCVCGGGGGWIGSLDIYFMDLQRLKKQAPAGWEGFGI